MIEADELAGPASRAGLIRWLARAQDPGTTSTAPDAAQAGEPAVGDRLAFFAAALSHDLLQPVAATAGFLGLLEQHATELDDEHRDWLQRAIRANSCVTEAVQALHRAATDDHLELTPLAVGRLITDVVADFSLGAEAFPVEGVGLPNVMSDRGLLAQVLTNLLQNASRYRSPDRPLRVQITARRDDIFWEISVADTGLGIDADELESVFERGVRGRSAEGTVGTGTGLATVRSAMRRMGGDAWAEPHEGGACVCLRLRGAASA